MAVAPQYRTHHAGRSIEWAANAKVTGALVRQAPLRSVILRPQPKDLSRATFWYENEFTVRAIENLGYTDVRARVSFGDFLGFKAEAPTSISRRGKEYANESGGRGESYLLWTVEAAAAAWAGRWGWRRGVWFVYSQSS